MVVDGQKAGDKVLVAVDLQVDGGVEEELLQAELQAAAVVAVHANAGAQAGPLQGDAIAAEVPC